MAEESPIKATSDSIDTVVHELRGPLTVIRGYLEVLGKPIDDVQRQRSIGAALRAVDRLQMMLNEMTTSDLDLASVRKGHIVPVDPVALAADVCDELAPFFNCSLVSDEPVRWPRADVTRLRQALVNLIGNAGEHGGGKVIIQVTEEDGYVIWAVEDNGPGIAPEDRDSVLMPGTRLGEAQRGRGLGLTISSAIAHAHGGSIAISDPRVLTGARVEFRLPLSD
ncbi:MAG: HAMP domain-containing histidine kinase [Actinobacteria bacterium]|nr:HAMP domain-containing histidine kinase [Actinomycetota bacterium]MCG2807662.1 HAMP domain-containing histidine kinase [Coriobacteriia bacterium]